MNMKKILSAFLALVLCFGLSVQAFASPADDYVDLAETVAQHYRYGDHELIKISHPDHPTNSRGLSKKYADGIVDYLGNSKIGITGVDEGANGQGDRGQTYCWGGVGYGDWMYVNTLYSAAGNTAALFPSAGGEGYSPELMNKISECIYRGDIFLEEEDGGNPGCVLVKINVKTGETKLIMSSEMTEDSYGNNYGGYYAHAGGINPQFRNALEFNDKLYFCGAPAGIPSIWEIDPNNNDAFRRVYADPILVKNPGLIIQAIQEDHLCSAIRGMTVMDEHLVISCVGPDANPYIAVSKTSDPADGFTVIAQSYVEDTDNTEVAELLGYPACRLTDSIYGGSIWEMVEFNGKLYVALCTGTPANKPTPTSMQSFAIMCGEYTGDMTDRDNWEWSVVVGDEKDGAKYPFGIDPERDRSGACCMMVFKDHLYIGEYNDTEIAVIDMICNGMDSQFMADNLQQSVNLYRMDKNEEFELVAGNRTKMFPKSLSGLHSGFGEKGTDHGNQYVWQMRVFQDKLYIGTFDESDVLYPLAQISNGDLISMSKEEWLVQLRYIKDLILELIKGGKGDGKNTDTLTAMLDAQNEMEAMLAAEPMDVVNMPSTMRSGVIDTLVEMHKSMVLLAEFLDQDETWTTEQQVAAKQNFVNLYNGIYNFYTENKSIIPAPLCKIYEKIINNKTFKVINNMGRCLYYLSDCTDGFDMFVTEDGEHLDCITRDGMGDPYNQGLRAFAMNDSVENPWMCIGTANLFYGTQVWRLEGEGLNLAPGEIGKPAEPQIPEMYFEDVHENDWFYDAVEYVYNRNIMTGITEHLFAPNMSANREMMVTMLWRMAGSPEPVARHSFWDVKEDSYSDKAISWAVENGIARGMSNEFFAPLAPVTREQMATFLYRFAQYQGMDTRVTGKLPFEDANKVSPWGYQELTWCYQQGIIQGFEGNLVKPQSLASRAQLATVIMRFMEKTNVQ